MSQEHLIIGSSSYLKMFINVLAPFCISSFFLLSVQANSTEVVSNKTFIVPQESTPTVTSTSITNVTCEQYTTCKSCLEIKECYFCQENNKCQLYVLKDILPSKECKLKDVYFETCSISLLVAIVLISIAAAIVLLALIVCCCFCCCRSGSRFKLSKEDLKWARQREERRMRAEEKRKERSARTEEIRRKYGLFKDDSPYQRFDA